MNDALLRNILQAAETRAEAILKAEREYSTSLRQLLDQTMTRKEATDEVRS